MQRTVLPILHGVPPYQRCGVPPRSPRHVAACAASGEATTPGCCVGSIGAVAWTGVTTAYGWNVTLALDGNGHTFNDLFLALNSPAYLEVAITEDAKFQRALLDATHIDRLNIGPIKTIQLNWLQPHEGNIVDFLFRNRAFQFDKGMIRI